MEMGVYVGLAITGARERDRDRDRAERKRNDEKTNGRTKAEVYGDEGKEGGAGGGEDVTHQIKSRGSDCPGACS